MTLDFFIRTAGLEEEIKEQLVEYYMNSLEYLIYLQWSALY